MIILFGLAHGAARESGVPQRESQPAGRRVPDSLGQLQPLLKSSLLVANC